MISLRWFNCSLGEGSFYYKVYRKSDGYLNKQVSSFKESSKKYRHGLSFFVFIKKFAIFQIIRLYNWFILILRKINLKVGKLLKKASLKKKGETVSEYLRNISDYKES
jgi:hypothetical protein